MDSHVHAQIDCTSNLDLQRNSHSTLQAAAMVAMNKPAMGDTHFIALVVIVQLVFFVVFGVWSSFHADALPPRDVLARNLSVTPLGLQNGFTAKQPRKLWLASFSSLLVVTSSSFQSSST